MLRMSFSKVSVATISLVILGGIALAAQDRYALKVPDGLAFADFRDYENWQYVAVSQVEDGIKVAAEMRAAFRPLRSA
jgi:hypothetical protein